MATWEMIVYKATADTGAATPYDTVSVATLSGYTGYTDTVSSPTKILAPQGMWEFEQYSIKDVNGSQFGRSRKRRTFDVELRPFRYNASTSAPDIDDLDTLADFLDDATYLWVRITGGSRTYPGTTGTAIPVIMTGWSESVNKDIGTRAVNIQFAHRYRF
jgi:hypothetical protein